MLSFVFFIHVLATSRCFDLEIEGALHFGKDLMKRVNNLFNLNKDSQINARKDPIFRNDMDKEYNVGDIDDPLGVFEKKHPTDYVTEDPGIASHKKHDESKPWNSNMLINFKNYLSKGITKLNFFGNLQISNASYIKSLLDKATKKYTEHMNSYYNNISKKQPKNDLDREMIVLDMIEATDHFLKIAARRLLRGIDAGAPEYTYDNDIILKVEKIVTEEKKEAFQFACSTLKVCRPFRGFVDKLSDLISEIQMLDDKPFKRVIEDAVKTIEGKHWFFQKIMTSDTRDTLLTKLTPWKKDAEFMKEFLTVIQAVILQRYKLFKNDNPEVKTKTTAVRVLLDLIDKVFDTFDKEIFDLEIDMITSSIKEWAEGGSDSKISPQKFINHVVEMLNYHWSGHTKEDVKVLIELMVLGTTQNEYVYDEVFSKGAYNKHGDESSIHSDSE